MANANSGALVDDVGSPPAAQGRARAEVRATHVGAPNAAPAANQHDANRDDRHCSQGEQGCSSPVRGDMEFEDMYAPFLLEPHLSLSYFVGPEVR